jgi:iron complex transport system ATP-binding protein
MSIATHDVKWGAGGRMIVDGVTLNAAPGTTLGLIGPNGSGKSSLLRLICGLRKVTAGIVTLGDADIRRFSRRDLARRIAFVEQQVNTDELLTIEDVVRLGRTPHNGPLAAWSARDQDAVEHALRHTNLLHLRSRYWQSLSGGEKQRSQIARALAQSPSELLLDEPTNHLDVQHQLEILQLISQLPLTSIVALHDLNLAAMFCDELAVLQAARLVAVGKPEHVLTPDLIRDVFGVRAEIGLSPFHGKPHIHFAPDHAATTLRPTTPATMASAQASFTAVSVSPRKK